MSNPNSALEECTEEMSHPRVTVRANGRVATFLNPHRTNIKKIDVDCWLCNVEVKADFVVSKVGAVDVIVELKGKDIDHAIEQLLATLKKWKAVPPYSPKVGSLIVFTRSPRRSAELDNVKLRFLKQQAIWLEMGKSGVRDYDFKMFTGARA